MCTSAFCVLKCVLARAYLKYVHFLLKWLLCYLVPAAKANFSSVKFFKIWKYFSSHIGPKCRERTHL